MRSLSKSLLFAIAICGAANLALGRTWTDKKGHIIEAELVDIQDGIARLKREDGKIVNVPLERLSQADRDFIAPPFIVPAAAPKRPASSVATTPGKTTSSNSNGVTIDVVGLEINKPVSQEPQPENGIMPTAPGTRFNLLVSAPARQIVRIDQTESKVVACTDNVGGILYKNPKDASERAPYPPFLLRFRPDRRSGLIEIMLPDPPTAGATKIHLRGELVLHCGEGEKTADQAGVSLKSASKITVGPIPFKLEPGQPGGGIFPTVAGFFPLPKGAQTGPPSTEPPPEKGTPTISSSAQPQSTEVPSNEEGTVIQLTTNQDDDIIKKIIFLDSAGKEIPQQEFFRSSSAMSLGPGGINGTMTNQRSISLAGKIEKATVRVASYEKIETIHVPIDVEFGVGL